MESARGEISDFELRQAIMETAKKALHRFVADLASSGDPYFERDRSLLLGFDRVMHPENRSPRRQGPRASRLGSKQIRAV
jgi:hypothetical protein